MPVVQSTIDKTKNRYAIAFAFRPGESGVRYSYELPYAGNAASIKLPTVYPDAKLLMLGAPSLQIGGDGLEPNGQEQGMNIYGRGPLAKGSVYSVSVSGTAPPPNARGGGGDADGGGQAGSGRGGAEPSFGDADSGAAGCVEVAAGCWFPWLVRDGRDISGAEAGRGCRGCSWRGDSGRGAGSGTRRDEESCVAGERASGIAAASPTIDDVDAAVGSSLDSLKDQIFRLELRRQAGTISEEEYAQERARAEKVLRDLVRG